jgi:hypothetical protein
MSRFFTPPDPSDSPKEAASGSEMFAESAMESRHVRIETSFTEALYLTLGTRKSLTGSARRDYRSYSEAARRAREIFPVLRSICGELGCELVEPAFPALSPSVSEERRSEAMDRTVSNWCAAIERQMRSDRIGRLAVLGNDAVQFTFFEVHTQRGLWTHKFNRTKFTQELVDARAYPLPADHVPQPAKAKRIVRQLASVPELARFCRIVAGMQVSRASGIQDRWRDDTALARGVKGAARFVTTNAAAAGVAVGTATTASLAALAKHVQAAAQAVAKADPAIVLGDVVFYGWD